MVRVVARVGERYGQPWTDWGWSCDCGRPKEPKWTDRRTAVDRAREHEDWHQRREADPVTEEQVRRLDQERTDSLRWRG